MRQASASTSPRAVRRDALENRERILRAAAQAFADKGWDVSLIEIARRAGVGNATIHRHFTKEQLLAELFQEREQQLGAALEEALHDPDPWRGLVGFLELVFTDMEQNRALAQLATLRLRSDSVHVRKFGLLVKRARDVGALRPDITAQDVQLVLMGIGQTINVAAGVNRGQWRRHFAIILAGLRNDNDPLPGTSMSERQLEQAVRRQVAHLL